MKQPDVRAFLWEIRDGCARLTEVGETRTFDEYTSDAWFRMGVERQFELIAEALRNVMRSDPSIGERITAAPAIIAFRNRIAHDYWKIEPAIVWATIHDHVPLLHQEVTAILDALPPP